MREAISFTYDGISSDDKRVFIASPSGGLFDESFMATRSIVETKIPNNPNPYLQRVDYEPLSFPLSFYMDGWKYGENHREIAQWLFQSYYKPMTFETHPNRLVYALIEGDSRLIHNGFDGYVEMNVRCNSPWVYSFPHETEYVNANDNPNDNILNSGDLPIKPKVWIKKIGAGSISITNKANAQKVEITDLQDGEEVFIDFAREEIVSSLQYLNIYHYDHHNDVWLQFELEDNELLYEGNFEIKYEYQYKYLNFWGE